MISVSVCVCVCERERERESTSKGNLNKIIEESNQYLERINK